MSTDNDHDPATCKVCEWGGEDECRRNREWLAEYSDWYRRKTEGQAEGS